MNTATRQHKLWDLAPASHGPIVGTCLPMAELRRLTDKIFGGRSSLDDFDLVHGVAAQCSTRNKVSQALQREFDRRHAETLRRFAKAATPQALAALWDEALQSGDVGGALWAALTHACVDEALLARTQRELCLLQYARVLAIPREAAALAALRAENQALQADALRAAQRHAAWRDEALAHRSALAAEVASLRGRLMAQDALIGQLREQMPGHEALMQRVAELTQRLAVAQRAGPVLRRPRAVAEAAEIVETAATFAPLEAVEAIEAIEAIETAALSSTAAMATPWLRRASVLCVGGRSGQVPLYRKLVERQGAHFSHHDGGIEDNPHRLDAQLAAADLVVCQAGCLNHNAYARVKEHCKRSGKPCVYLAKPGAGSFVRALARGAASVPKGAVQNL